MFALQCPKCGSTRIHRGYNRLSLFKRLLGRKSLLCNNCNLLFESFALESDLEKAKTRRRKRWTPPGEDADDSRPPLRAENAPENKLTQSIAREVSAVPSTVAALSGATQEFAAEGTAPDSVTLERGGATRVAQPASPTPVGDNKTAEDTENAEDMLLDASGEPDKNAPASFNIKPSSSVAPAAPAVTASGAKAAKSHEFVTSSSLAAADELQPTRWDYLEFAKYYAKLRLKSLFRMHSSSHPMDVKFRWRNWWHWQRRKRLGI